MFVLGNLLTALARVLHIVLNSLSWLILIRALLSWVNPDPFNPIVQFLYRFTEPILIPIRQAIMRFFPRSAFDFSPMIAWLLILFLDDFLVGTVYQIGMKLTQ